MKLALAILVAILAIAVLAVPASAQVVVPSPDPIVSITAGTPGDFKEALGGSMPAPILLPNAVEQSQAEPWTMSVIYTHGLKTGSDSMAGALGIPCGSINTVKLNADILLAAKPGEGGKWGIGASVNLGNQETSHAKLGAGYLAEWMAYLGYTFIN